MPRPLYAWYALYMRLGGPQDQSGRVRKISTLPEFDPRSFPPVSSGMLEFVPTDSIVEVHVSVSQQMSAFLTNTEAQYHPTPSPHLNRLTGLK